MKNELYFRRPSAFVLHRSFAAYDQHNQFPCGVTPDFETRFACRSAAGFRFFYDAATDDREESESVESQRLAASRARYSSEARLRPFIQLSGLGSTGVQLKSGPVTRRSQRVRTAAASRARARDARLKSNQPPKPGSTGMQYQQYLRSEHWRLLRGAKLQIAPRCEKCRSKEEIEVHHKIYRTSWHDSKLQDLQTLCHGCHMMEHAKEWERLAHYLQPSPPPKHVSDYKETVSRRPEAKQHPKLPIPKRPKNHPVWKGPYEMRPATMNKLRQQAGMKLPVAVNGVYTFHPI